MKLYKRLKGGKITLKEELWIAILVVIILGFVSSLLISTQSAKNYFSTQLHLKNVDGANSLALMLSQLHKDPVEIELLISATFDTGHYQRIELIDPQGETIIKRSFQGEHTLHTPAWFRNIYQLDVSPGVSQVSDGWQQFGTLYVESHSHYTQDALWKSAVKLFYSFLVVAIVTCFAGALFLRKILKPLDDVVNQATALGEKRFIKSTVPTTYEFARLVTSMNSLSSRFQAIVKEDRKRLEEMRFKSQHDELTGLANREYFNATLETTLSKNKERAHGALFLFRVIGLDSYADSQGRLAMVNLLGDFSKSLVLFLEANENRFSESHVARLSHTDFVVLFSDVDDLNLLSEQIFLIHQAMVVDCEFADLAISHGCTHIVKDDSRFDVLKRLDVLLKQALATSGCARSVDNNAPTDELFSAPEQWREAIVTALENKDFQLYFHPVNDFNEQAIQQQLSLELKLNGEMYQFGFYYQWAKKLSLLAQLDWGLIKLLVQNHILEQSDQAVSVELSAETLLDDSAIASILTYLSTFPQLSKNICFDVRANFAVAELALFKDFCQQVHCIGAKVALKRVGAEFTKIKKLQEFGLEMIKIDSAYGHNISFNQDNQSFLRGVCSLAHSIGIKVIAEGVSNPEDQAVLKQLGFDGILLQK